MSSSDDKPPSKPGSPGGGVKHDDRGNAIWQWAVDSGKFAIDSTSRLLKRLEVPGLSLEDHKPPTGKEPQGPEPADPGAARAKPATVAKPNPDAGYDPYGGRQSAAHRPAALRPATPRPAAVTKPAAAPRPSLLQRLFRKD